MSDDGVRSKITYVVEDDGRVYLAVADVAALWRLALAGSDSDDPWVQIACRWIEESLASLDTFARSVAIDVLEMGKPCDEAHVTRADG